MPTLADGAHARRWLCCAALACAALALSRTTHAGTETAPPPKKTGKRAQTIKIRQDKSGSQESSAQRDRRLKRECKGLPNAGACLGYASR